MSAAIVSPRPQSTMIDVAAIRRDFPILHQTINGKPLVYLDNAASSQRPRAVIEAISAYYEHDHANVHRGVHTLSQRATDAYEGAREDVRRFINARESAEVIFVRGTTEAINLVAQSYARPRLGPGDEILISALEHHANIVSWQLVCEQTGATLKVIPINTAGEVDVEALESLIGPRTKLLAIAHVSNALGTIVPVERCIAIAKRHGVPVLLDGAQAVPHSVVDVRKLDCDFYCFSAHKMIGPTGIGVLYGRRALLEAMPPWQGGGDMILSVTFAKTTYNQLPWKFEAGTPNIAGVVGLGAAIRYLEGIGMERIAAYEHELLEYATARLACVPGLRIVGTSPRKASVVSFVIEHMHPHDIGTIVDTDGIAIRTGHHCAMPVMEFFAVPATARASLSFYNTFEEIDRLAASLEHARSILT
jgi:cysteine desulfurase / selenocysteine lyase